MNNVKVLITCEHGGNQLPDEYQVLFHDHESLLQSHRGYDIGALIAAKKIADEYAHEVGFSQTSRLLIDLNRSIGHPKLFSEVTKPLSGDEKKSIVDTYYMPHRQKIERVIHQWCNANDSVLHLAIHSFTPELNGEIRQADIGLLFDPQRLPEKTFCLAWQKNLKLALPSLVIRRNYPYKGTSDGLTVYLRRKFPAASYQGIELEINQKLFSQSSVKIDSLLKGLVESLGFIR